LVKLALTVVTMALMTLAGRRYYPVHVDVPLFGFAMTLLISAWSILSMGFLIASIVPTARFATDDVRGVPAPGDLESGCVVGAPRQRRGTGSRFCDLHRDLGQGFPLGIEQASSERR
jgi:hypothetical protein